MRLLLRGLLGLLVLLAACNRSDVPTVAQDSRKKDTPAVGSETSGEAPDLADRAFPLLAWAVHMLSNEYFDSGRVEAQAQLESALDALGMHTPEFFARKAEGGDAMVVRVRASSSTFRTDDVETLDDAARRLEEVLVFAQTVLDLEPEALHELEYAAINGLLSPLDPHTILLTPEEHADLGERTRGTFGGIGAEIRVERRNVVIVRVLPGMPAEAGGVMAGDVILRIGDQSTVSMSVTEAQTLLRGPVGTTVEIKVRRKDRTVDLKIERAVIRLDSVTATPLPGGVEHVRVTHFQEDTSAKLREAILAALEANRLNALVLDLRGNGGGLLVQATEIVDLFVPKGELVIVRSAFGREVDEAEDTTVVPPELPVIVLVDEEAASAAEIVSGGLQALGRATVVGRSTFGKGSVQVVRPAAPYGRELALKLTIAEYLVAGDQRIQARGVVPDLELLPIEPTGVEHVVRYYDRERFERARERARMAHHPSAKHELAAKGSSDAAHFLRYLATTELPAELTSAPDDAKAVLRDPEVRIARRVALAHSDIDKETAVLQAAEGPRIASALKKWGVRWSEEGVNDAPISATAKVLGEMPVEAGSSFELEISVTNPTAQTLQRVHAITDCERERLDGIEVLFGDISAGETVTRKVELHVMPWDGRYVGDLDVAVHLGEPGEIPDAAARAVFETTALPEPALSYDVWIVDDPALVKDAPKRPKAEPIPGLPAFEVAGNGDGMLQPGERVLLAFTAYNHGVGDSPDVRAFLRNLSGEQGLLEEGFIALGPIATGKSVSGAFGISVGEHADPSRPFLLDLAVGDAVRRVAAGNKLTLRVLPESNELVETKERIAVGEETVRLRSGAHASAPIVATAKLDEILLSSGTVGSWKVVPAGVGNGRRLFFPADLPGLRPATKKDKVTQLELLRSVHPPTVDLQDVPRMTTASAITLAGIVKHPEKVRDVVVMVRPLGVGHVDRKVDYFAAAAEANTLEFSTEVPLQPGGNRIYLLARSRDKIQTPRELWVYRAEAG